MPLAEMSWSMMPHFMPTKSPSAACARRAMVAGGRSRPPSTESAVPTATDSEADDDKPDPRGMVPATARSAPGSA